MAVEGGWPRKGFPSTVLPETEGTKRPPSMKLDSDPTSVATAQGDLTLHVFLRWPQPIGALMPLLSSLDDILAQARMADLVRNSTANLDATLKAFYSLREAQIVIEQWRIEYNTHRPHSALGKRGGGDGWVLRGSPVVFPRAPTAWD